MALTVLSRPQKALTVNNPPEVYEESYYTSRWNASELPMQYQIESDLYPNNIVDSVDSFSSVDNDGGYARFELSGSYEIYLKLEYVEVISSSVSSYIGIWKIRKVFAEYITLDVAFDSDATGTLQRTYRNYYVNVKLYAGIPSGHPLESEDPMSLISTILVEPRTDNIATIDVSGLVKSKVNGTIDLDSSQNHTNQWTSFYIEFAETYDVSNGSTVSSQTTAYTLDVYEDCTESNELVNSEFSSDPSGDWDNVESNTEANGELWDWTGTEMNVVLTEGVTDSYSQIFKQDFVFSQGLSYNLVYEINLLSITTTCTFDVYLDAGLPTETLIYRRILGDAGILSVNAFITPSSSYSNIGFKIALRLGIGDLEVDVNNFNVISEGCTAYIFSLYSKMPFQYVNGGNVGQFVQNSNQNVFENKFLTLFERPTYFIGKTFYLSTIIPEETLSLLSGVGGGALRVIQYDSQNNALQTDRITIEQEGDGVYRFTLDSISFLSSTKYATAQLIIEPLNLFQDGDSGTFDTTSDPTGNPPSDWNLSKDATSEIEFDNSLFFDGTGSLRFNTRSIFNDDYTLAFTNQGRIGTSNQGFNITDFTGLDFTGDFTIEFRHYLTSFDGSFPFLLGIRFTDNTDFILYYLSNIRVRSTYLFALPNISANKRDTTANVVIGQFNHIVLSFKEGVSCAIYINGVKTERTTDVGIAGTQIPQNIRIYGSADSNVYNANGYAKGVRLFTGYAATAGDVTNLYNSSTSVIQDVPIGMLPFLDREFLLNQEQGRTVIEKTGFNEQLNDVTGYSDANILFGGGVWVDENDI